VEILLCQAIRYAVRFTRAAEFRIAAHILRPETMDHEGIGARTLDRALASAFGRAIAGRPAERQNVMIELTGNMTTLLRVSRREQRCAEQEERGQSRTRCL